MVGALIREVRHHPLLWLLAFVPATLIAAKARPDLHTLLFVLSVLAIVPLAALLSRATEAVAAKTGDATGGLLNATLGNLTELVIALTALRAGDYVLVKASIAGAIVTNTLFMLGGSLLLGGLKHHVQEFNRATARFQAGLLYLGTVALLTPSLAVYGSTPTSAAYTLLGAAPPGTNIVYFAFVNYTTLGYGDVVPVERWKLLGPITAMNGILLFGWSTAVIFEVLRAAMRSRGEFARTNE